MSRTTILKIQITKKYQTQQFKHIETSNNNPFGINWGDGTSENSYYSHIYQEPGEYQIILSDNISYFYFDTKNNYLKQIIQLNEMHSYKNMFKNCINLTAIAPGIQLKLNSSTINASYESMFQNCIMLNACTLQLDPIAYSYKNMFKNCVELTTCTISFLSDINENYESAEINQISFYGMFEKCISLTNIFFNNKDYNLYTPVNCSCMFKNCTQLLQLTNNFIIPNSTKTCAQMFYNCIKLKSLPDNFTIPYGVINCDNMFYCNISLEKLPKQFVLPDTIISCAYMFFYNYNLTDINNINIITNNLKNAEYMFYNCNNLVYDISNLFVDSYEIPTNVSQTQLNINYMFAFDSNIYGILKNSILEQLFKCQFNDLCNCMYCANANNISPAKTIGTFINCVKVLTIYEMSNITKNGNIEELTNLKLNTLNKSILVEREIIKKFIPAPTKLVVIPPKNTSTGFISFYLPTYEQYGQYNHEYQQLLIITRYNQNNQMLSTQTIDAFTSRLYIYDYVKDTYKYIFLFYNMCPQYIRSSIQMTMVCVENICNTINNCNNMFNKDNSINHTSNTAIHISFDQNFYMPQSITSCDYMFHGIGHDQDSYNNHLQKLDLTNFTFCYKDQLDNITKRSSVLSCKGLFQNSYIYRDNNYIIDFTNFQFGPSMLDVSFLFYHTENLDKLPETFKLTEPIKNMQYFWRTVYQLKISIQSIQQFLQI